MGKLYKRGDTYYADYFDREGRRRRESTRTGDPVVARARLRELELATTDRAAHQTEALDASLKYFVDVACAGRSEGTVSCYRQKARHLSRLIGGELVDRITREMIERYIATRLEEGAHRHSVHKELVVLRGALKSAKGRGRFHQSLEVVPEFDSGYVPRTTYQTKEQFLALADHLVPPAREAATKRELELRADRVANRTLYCLLVAFASPRAGEVEKIEAHHIDLLRGVLRIPKGKTISRVIAIHPVLRPWLEQDFEPGPIVEPWSNVRRDLEAACKRAGVPKVTPNDLRRTFASWLVQEGVSLYIVSKLLGHSSTRMVERVYGQLDDATLAMAIARLPGACDAGVSRALPTRGADGTHGTPSSSPTITNSVEESFSSQTSEVPRVGIEPTTRGFSGLRDRAPKRKDSRTLLRLVK